MSTGNAFYYTVGQLTDSETESGDNVFKGFEHFISESHRAKLLPDLLYGIHFRRVDSWGVLNFQEALSQYDFSIMGIPIEPDFSGRVIKARRKKENGCE